MKSVVGKNLKSLRVANGYNQENVAEFMGINRSSVGCARKSGIVVRLRPQSVF